MTEKKNTIGTRILNSLEVAMGGIVKVDETIKRGGEIMEEGGRMTRFLVANLLSSASEDLQRADLPSAITSRPAISLVLKGIKRDVITGLEKASYFIRPEN